MTRRFAQVPRSAFVRTVKPIARWLLRKVSGGRLDALGGALMEEQLFRAIRQGAPHGEGGGRRLEWTAPLSVLSPNTWLAHPGSAGQAVLGEIHICDDEGEEVAQGDIGTVYFANGPQFEYHNEPEKTKKSYNSQVNRDDNGVVSRFLRQRLAQCAALLTDR